MDQNIKPITYHIDRLPNSDLVNYIAQFNQNIYVLNSIFLSLSASIIFIMAFAYMRNRDGVAQSITNVFFTPILACAIISVYYTKKFIVVDEGYINFSHAYNLYNYGILSFLSDRLSDGTTEILAVLMITPFGDSFESLYVAYFFITLLAIWATIIFMFLIFKELLGEGKLTYLACIPFAFVFFIFIETHFIITIIGGFNNMVSVALFFATIYALLRDNSKWTLVLAFLCAFSRIDSVAWLFALFIADSIAKKRIHIHLIVASVLGLATLLLFFKIYYGHIIPTPVMTKSTTAIFFETIMGRLPYIFLLSILFVPAILVWHKCVSIKNKTFFGLLMVFGFLGSCAIILRDSVHQFSYFRYVLPFIFSMLLGISIGGYFVLKTLIEKMPILKNVFPVCSIFLAGALLFFGFKSEEFEKQSTEYRIQLGNSLPMDMSLMSYEVSGMFIPRENRKSIELYGFTNREISKMKDNSCNVHFIRKSLRLEILDGSTAFIKSCVKNIVSHYKADMIFILERPNGYQFKDLIANLYLNIKDSKEMNYIRDNYEIIYLSFSENLDNYPGLFMLVKKHKMNVFNRHMISKGFNRVPFPKESRRFVNDYLQSIDIIQVKNSIGD